MILYYIAPMRILGFENKTSFLEPLTYLERCASKNTEEWWYRELWRPSRCRATAILLYFPALFVPAPERAVYSTHSILKSSQMTTTLASYVTCDLDL